MSTSAIEGLTVGQALREAWDSAQLQLADPGAYLGPFTNAVFYGLMRALRTFPSYEWAYLVVAFEGRNRCIVRGPMKCGDDAVRCANKIVSPVVIVGPVALDTIGDLDDEVIGAGLCVIEAVS